MTKYGADTIDGLTIGNEVADTPSNIMDKVRDVRTYLSDVVGYKGPISIVHTWVEVMNNPVLCNADRVAINAHAFYDGGVKSAGAGDFIKDVVIPNIKKACAPYPEVNNIVITEGGWPSRGKSNGAAVTSVADEQATLSTVLPRTLTPLHLRPTTRPGNRGTRTKEVSPLRAHRSEHQDNTDFCVCRLRYLVQGY